MSSFVRYFPEPYWQGVAAPASLTLLSLASLLWRRGYASRAVLLSGGMWAAALPEANTGVGSLAEPMAMAAAISTGVFLLPVSLVLTAAELSLAAAAFLWQQEGLVLARSAGVGLLLICGVGGSVAQALSQAEETGLRAWRYAGEAMRRRGELERANKALREMYALLERSNRELEVARREAEEARLVKARFAANISHELRTPLNLILGFSRVMYQSPEVYGPVNWTPELRLDVRRIYRASHHLLSMIDDILDLSRIEARRLPLDLRMVSIKPLINEVAAMTQGLLRNSPLTLHVDVAEDLPEVVADRVRLRQVLLNLLTNATRFTSEGYISLSAYLGDGELVFEVADTGVGIAEEDLASMFDEFSQAKAPVASGPGGAGLGLAICREIVQLHGGRIEVQSRLGEGTRFRFTIPVPGSGKSRSRLSYNNPEGWQPPLLGEGAGDAVVVLAGNASDARLVARALEGLRALPVTELQALAEVVEAEHPRAAVLVRDPVDLAPAPAEAGQDYMPKPEDVWQATGRWDLPVIECSIPGDSAARYHLGVSAYLPKPVKPEDLLAAIRDGNRPVRSALVVDDDASARVLLDRVLTPALPQCCIVSCSSAREAMAALRRERFDVVILDLMMPEVGGLEMLAQARADGLLPDTRVLVVTGADPLDQLPPVTPTSLRFTRIEPPTRGTWTRVLRAMLGAAAPDYSVAAPGPLPAAGPLGSQAS
jgi:signal transduction histidine kinase/CheY-like chemotaxis protein